MVATRGDKSDSQASRREIDWPGRCIGPISRPGSPYGVRSRRENVQEPGGGGQKVEVGSMAVAVGPVATVLLVVCAQGRLRLVHRQAVRGGGKSR